jgi:hypothetical protein
MAAVAATVFDFYRGSEDVGASVVATDVLNAWRWLIGLEAAALCFHLLAGGGDAGAEQMAVGLTFDGELLFQVLDAFRVGVESLLQRRVEFLEPLFQLVHLGFGFLLHGEHLGALAKQRVHDFFFHPAEHTRADGFLRARSLGLGGKGAVLPGERLGIAVCECRR